MVEWWSNWTSNINWQASHERDAITLWDVGTRQELLKLGGVGIPLPVGLWTEDGDVILADPPWEEIEAAEAKEKAEGQRP